MDAIAPILKILLPVGIGILMRQTRIFDAEDACRMRKLCVRFTIPQLIFTSMYEMNLSELREAVPMCLALILFTVLFYGVGWLTSIRFRPEPRQTAIHAAITFGNYGWIGWAAAELFFGPEGYRRAVFFTMLWWPVFYGFGMTIGRLHHGREKAGGRWLQVLLMAAPALLAIALGIGLNAAGRPLGQTNILYETLETFGAMSIPLILLSVGVQLEFKGLRAHVASAAVVSAVRLLIGPLIGLAVLWLLRRTVGCDEISAGVILLESAMPVATMTPALAESYDMDLNSVGASIVLSTVLSLITVPLWLQLFGASVGG